MKDEQAGLLKRCHMKKQTIITHGEKNPKNKNQKNPKLLGLCKESNQPVDLISPFAAGCHHGDTDKEIFQDQIISVIRWRDTDHLERYCVLDAQKSSRHGFVKIVEEINSKHIMLSRKMPSNFWKSQPENFL